MGQCLDLLISIIGLILIFVFYSWLLFILPYRMAKKRGRSTIRWTILFWILTPFWGAILLLILGDSKEKIKQDILHEINNRNNL